MNSNAKCNENNLITELSNSLSRIVTSDCKNTDEFNNVKDLMNQISNKIKHNNSTYGGKIQTLRDAYSSGLNEVFLNIQLESGTANCSNINLTINKLNDLPLDFLTN